MAAKSPDLMGSQNIPGAIKRYYASTPKKLLTRCI